MNCNLQQHHQIFHFFFPGDYFNKAVLHIFNCIVCNKILKTNFVVIQLPYRILTFLWTYWDKKKGGACKWEVTFYGLRIIFGNLELVVKRAGVVKLLVNCICIFCNVAYLTVVGKRIEGTFNKF